MSVAPLLFALVTKRGYKQATIWLVSGHQASELPKSRAGQAERFSKATSRGHSSRIAPSRAGTTAQLR